MDLYLDIGPFLLIFFHWLLKPRFQTNSFEYVTYFLIVFLYFKTDLHLLPGFKIKLPHVIKPKIWLETLLVSFVRNNLYLEWRDGCEYDGVRGRIYNLHVLNKFFIWKYISDYTIFAQRYIRFFFRNFLNLLTLSIFLIFRSNQ